MAPRCTSTTEHRGSRRRSFSHTIALSVAKKFSPGWTLHRRFSLLWGIVLFYAIPGSNTLLPAEWCLRPRKPQRFFATRPDATLWQRGLRRRVTWMCACAQKSPCAAGFRVANHSDSIALWSRGNFRGAAAFTARRRNHSSREDRRGRRPLAKTAQPGDDAD